MDGKYNYGCEWRSTDEVQNSFGTEGINADVLKTESFYIFEKLPEEVFGMPYELSFIVGDTLYKYKGK